MKSLLKYMALALVVGLVFYGFDAAANENVFTKAINTLAVVFSNVRKVVYIIGAFGLIGIAIGGIVGKINFKWLGYLAAGLAIVAVADLFIQYVIGVNNNTIEKAEVDWTQLKD